MLLSATADANARDCHGQSPIFFAPSRQICETLMARGADLSVVNIRNQTPLHLLARAGLHDAAACILEVLQAPVLELEDLTGTTPLLHAAHSKVKSIVRMLRAKKDHAPDTYLPIQAEPEAGSAGYQSAQSMFVFCALKGISGECLRLTSSDARSLKKHSVGSVTRCTLVAVWQDFVAMFPELQAGFRETARSGESVLAGEVADVSEHASETDSFASQQVFAEEAQAGIEEEDGCLFWQVLLKKESDQDKFGFAQANGKMEFEIRLEGKFESSKRPRLPGPDMLVVKRIYPDGLLQKWNARVPQLEVRPQDRILAVNDQTDVEAMAREIREPRVFLQMVRFPDRFIIGLSKENGSKLGFRFERPQGTFAEEVRITEVLDDGALMAYNKHQVEMGRYAFVVLPEMRIDRVNDVWGDAELIANELKSAMAVDLHIRRADDFPSTPTP
ncbi:EHMT1 [Symbiodinium natans]|uniref:EHMT1 protein n=1 Tax=Symbiodinium natans TaxID=878477 RepID=A0A812JL17_9DINO|nr:EHMT1 [Symbiodinium natans]